MTGNSDPDGFEEFFERATDFKPYPYQRRLAEDDPLPSCLKVQQYRWPVHFGLINRFHWMTGDITEIEGCAI